MRLMIRDNSQEAASYIAEYIIGRINAAAPTAARPFVLGLPTGSSPIPIYRELIAAYRAGIISFRYVMTFNMDEYIGLPRDHPESYHSFMDRHLFSSIDIPPENINILDGNAPDLEIECSEYEAKIKAVGGIDLFLGGVGGDGHIAFNEPGSSLASRTRVKTLTYDTIKANARFFGGSIDLVPSMALTVGVQTILDAREVVIIATGMSKAVAVKRAVEDGISQSCTLSCLQMHPRSMIVVDEEATLELQVKTVRYFKSIESVSKRNYGTKTLSRLRTTSLGKYPRTPLRSQRGLEYEDPDDGELTPDSMSSRMALPI